MGPALLNCYENLSFSAFEGISVAEKSSNKKRHTHTPKKREIRHTAKKTIVSVISPQNASHDQKHTSLISNDRKSQLPYKKSRGRLRKITLPNALRKFGEKMTPKSQQQQQQQRSKLKCLFVLFWFHKLLPFP